jgi:hypothetical protein
MITYFYWAVIFGCAIAALAFIGGKYDNWKAAFITAAVITLIGWGAYFFHFEQVFVKRYGGVMTVTVPEGHHHILATWKDDNLWIENYNPEKNTCEFHEYSKGNMLQGKVTIKNCNPVAYSNQAAPNKPPVNSSAPTAP